jgi:hypothetical protein
MLKKYVALAAAVSRCDSVALIFESSERADAILQSEFGLFDPRQADVQLPVEFCLMPKAAKEPALEAADFVANSVGGMAHRIVAQRRDFPADFCSICGIAPLDFLDDPPAMNNRNPTRALVVGQFLRRSVWSRCTSLAV